MKNQMFMKNKIFYLIIIFLIVIVGTSCPERFYSISFRNDSHLTIAVCTGYALSDTLLPKKEPSHISIVKLNQIYSILDSFAGDIEYERFKKEPITFFVIDNTIYETEPWDSIRKYNKILKRMEVDYQMYTSYYRGIITYP